MKGVHITDFDEIGEVSSDPNEPAVFKTFYVRGGAFNREIKRRLSFRLTHH